MVCTDLRLSKITLQDHSVSDIRTCDGLPSREIESRTCDGLPYREIESRTWNSDGQYSECQRMVGADTWFKKVTREDNSTSEFRNSEELPQRKILGKL